ncbi:MAG: NAD(P)/FAD-dependent oxidoreductase [Candidatus Helarchaeota archaeon]
MFNEEREVVVIGGGVAGLAAAISFRRQGLEVALLEQANEFGRLIKGEIINKSAEIFHKLFHQDELPQTIHRIVYKSAKYYTPSARKYALRVFPSDEKVGIEYRELIDALVKLAHSEGVQLCLNSEVMEYLEEDGRIIGVKYQEFNDTKKLKSKVIIAAIGFHTSLKLPNSLKQPSLVCPAIKIIAEGFNIPNPHELEFFLLEEPGVIWIFPKLHQRAELGITLWQNTDERDLRKVLERAKLTHPILKKRLAQGSIIYYASEYLAFGGPASQVYVPNLFVIGDAMGHVGAVGGSGIVSSMTIGYEVGEQLGQQLKAVDRLQPNDFQETQRKIRRSTIGRWLKHEQSSAKAMRTILYQPRKSSEEIDHIWDKFKFFIENRGI